MNVQKKTKKKKKRKEISARKHEIHINNKVEMLMPMIKKRKNMTIELTGL